MAKALPVFAANPKGQLAENAPLMLHTRLEELYAWSHLIDDPSRIAELHNMRIAAKRLRYTMEIFAVCFPDKEYQWLSTQVKSIQEQIGEIHDADVRGPLFLDYIECHAARHPEIRIGLERLAQGEEVCRIRLYKKFIAYWNKLQKQDFKARFLQRLALPQYNHPTEDRPQYEN